MRTRLMLLIAVFIALLAMSALPAFAQEEGGRGGNGNGNQTPGEGVLIQQDHHSVIHEEEDNYRANGVVTRNNQRAVINFTDEDGCRNRVVLWVRNGEVGGDWFTYCER